MRRHLYTPTSVDSEWIAALELQRFWDAGTESRRGIPPSIESLLDQHPAWFGAAVVAAFPAHGALPALPISRQNDLWAILVGPAGPLSLGVETGAEIVADPHVGTWLQRPDDDRERRLSYLREILGLNVSGQSDLQYHWLHRAASVLLEAGRIGAVSSGLVVLSSNNANEKVQFKAFVEQQGAVFTESTLCWATTVRFRPFFLAWIDVP